MTPHLLFGRDRAGTPRRSDFLAEAGALLTDLTRYSGAIRTTAGLPRGDGHAVLVIPALFSTDFLTRGFRGAVAALGYRVTGWGAGINLGPTQKTWEALSVRLADLADRSGHKVSVVGHSLGGVIARALAHEYPAMVRGVITICSPFRLPAATPLAPIYRGLSLLHADNAILLPRIVAPPPVPTTAIYSPQDGIVAWASCIDDPGPGRENVAVYGRHATMLADARTLLVIAERLARTEANDTLAAIPLP